MPNLIRTKQPHRREAKGEIQRRQEKIDPERRPAVFTGKRLEALGERGRRVGGLVCVTWTGGLVETRARVVEAAPGPEGSEKSILQMRLQRYLLSGLRLSLR